ncbi:MAG: hypothetical protein Q8M29_07675 [Bacteroidota bacterium]|nr:hypothetical protein [Bacteroidota bacterium]
MKPNPTFINYMFIIILLSGCASGKRQHRKPVVYLYPKDTIDISVQVNYKGKLTVTYPEYKNKWNVIAYPDGKLINKADSMEYSYLFWEGESAAKESQSCTNGFVVKGEESHTFLQTKLKEIGLTPKEYNEFIVFWYPILKENNYNFIRFRVGKEYDEISTMNIIPKPDAMLRVFMDYKPVENFYSIEPQSFPMFERKGFTVVEWGGGAIEEENLNN